MPNIKKTKLPKNIEVIEETYHKAFTPTCEYEVIRQQNIAELHFQYEQIFGHKMSQTEATKYFSNEQNYKRKMEDLKHEATNMKRLKFKKEILSFMSKDSKSQPTPYFNMDEFITYVGKQNSQFTEKYAKEEIESMDEDFLLKENGQVFVMF